MKKVIAIGIIIILILGLLPSCSKELTEEEMEGDMGKEQNVSYEPFSLFAMDGEYSLTAEAGFNRDFFDEYDCTSTGDLLQAIVKYIIRIEKIDDTLFDFDSETGMFVMYSSDEDSLIKAASILSREMNRDQVLKDAMESEEVKEEREFSAKISNAVSEIMSTSDANLSAEEYLEQFSE